MSQIELEHYNAVTEAREAWVDAMLLTDDERAAEAAYNDALNELEV